MSLSERIRVFSELGNEHDGFDVSNARAMAALQAAEDRHFWHRARNELILQRLAMLGVGKGSRLLELGCGGGCVSAHLSLHGLEVVGVDGHRALLEQALRRAPKAHFWLHDLARGTDALPSERFDAVGLFDVLEHLDKPLAALEFARTMVSPGGWIVGTVPAMMTLWSQADEQAGHRTRYDCDRLNALLDRVGGSEVGEIVPFNRALVPLLWVRRQVVTKQSVAEVSEANFRVPPAPINHAMLWMLRAERRLAEVIPCKRLGGASLWFAVRVGDTR